MKVDDVMTSDVVSVSSATSLRDVARMLADQDISGLPVVDDGQLVGVVSEADILVKEMEHKERRGGVIGWILEPDVGWKENKLEARTAGDAMSAPVITVRATDAVAKAATIMVENGINRLPVVDQDGALVGIVARADLVDAFTQTDAEIEREIREDVLQHQFWVSSESVDVVVEDGVVTLGGRIENEALAEVLPRVVARVPGVVEVTSLLTWVGQGERAGA